MSSQAFVRSFPRLETIADLRNAYTWLANGLEAAVPDFLSRAAADNHKVAGAIYHFNDDVWLIPALTAFKKGSLSLAYNSTTQDAESDAAIAHLIAAGHPVAIFAKRTKANISHNKFLVARQGNNPQRLLIGRPTSPVQGSRGRRISCIPSTRQSWPSNILTATIAQRRHRHEGSDAVGRLVRAD